VPFWLWPRSKRDDILNSSRSKQPEMTTPQSNLLNTRFCTLNAPLYRNRLTKSGARQDSYQGCMELKSISPKTVQIAKCLCLFVEYGLPRFSSHNASTHSSDNMVPNYCSCHRCSIADLLFRLNTTKWQRQLIYPSYNFVLELINP
jgi:hypothetical protein